MLNLNLCLQGRSAGVSGQTVTIFFLADGNRLERQGSRQTVTTFPVGGGKEPTPDWKGRGAVVALATMEAVAGTLESRAKRA